MRTYMILGFWRIFCREAPAIYRYIPLIFDLDWPSRITIVRQTEWLAPLGVLCIGIVTDNCPCSTNSIVELIVSHDAIE
jgi:hypothetical protein